MSFTQGANRRDFLSFLGGGALLALGLRPAKAAETRIAGLIAEAQSKGSISAKIDFIAAALRGTRYYAHSLIGGPRRPEQFVVRDDGFDCITFCETVLAAAIAESRGEFEPVLKAIRYQDGIVNWYQRNHYFFEWSQRNVENKVCTPIDMAGSIEIEKNVSWDRALGRRHFTIRVIPRAVFLKNKSALASGDIIGFISRRSNLDYFHVGFIAFGSDGGLILRHASKSKRRVLDERMEPFLAVNRVHYVTLLRARESHAVAKAG